MSASRELIISPHCPKTLLQSSKLICQLVALFNQNPYWIKSARVKRMCGPFIFLIGWGTLIEVRSRASCPERCNAVTWRLVSAPVYRFEYVSWTMISFRKCWAFPDPVELDDMMPLTCKLGQQAGLETKILAFWRHSDSVRSIEFGAATGQRCKTWYDWLSVVSVVSQIEVWKSKKHANHER